MSQGQLSIATSKPRLQKKYPKPLVYIIFCQKSIATSSKLLHTCSSCIWVSSQHQWATAGWGRGAPQGWLPGESLGQGDLRRREGGPTIYRVRSGSMRCVQQAPRG